MSTKLTPYLEVPNSGIPDSYIESAPTWNAKSNKSNVITGQLTVAGWSSNVQTLTFASGTLPISGYAYTVTADPASLNNYCNANIYADNITTADSITFHCETTPTAAINIIILKIQVA